MIPPMGCMCKENPFLRLRQLLRGLGLSFLLLLSGFVAPSARAELNVLRQVESREEEGGVELRLFFGRKASVRRINAGRSELLVLDFPRAVFPEVRRRLSFDAPWLKQVTVAQFDAETVRLVLKRSEGLRIDLDQGEYKRGLGHRIVVSIRPPGETRAPETEVDSWQKPRLILDPGHGGKDPGAVGSHTNEKDLTTAVCRQIKALFDADGRIDCVLTRETDRFVRLRDRSHLAELARADLFVSVHANSSERHSVRGFEVYYHSFEAGDDASRAVAAKENEVIRLEGGPSSKEEKLVDLILKDMGRVAKLNKSVLLAGLVDQGVKRDLPMMKHRGVKKADFVVLRPVQTPAMLIEMGFISNPVEERLMKTSAFQKNMSRIVFRSVLDYFRRQGRLLTQAAQGMQAHVVRKGETLWALARRFETKIERLRVLNGLSSGDHLKVGQRLKIPADPVTCIIRESMNE